MTQCWESCQCVSIQSDTSGLFRCGNVYPIGEITVGVTYPSLSASVGVIDTTGQHSARLLVALMCHHARWRPKNTSTLIIHVRYQLRCRRFV